MRLTMAATGSPGASPGMAKIRVVPSHTVSKNMPRRRTTYPTVKLPMLLLLPPTDLGLALIRYFLLANEIRRYRYSPILLRYLFWLNHTSPRQVPSGPHRGFLKIRVCRDVAGFANIPTKLQNTGHRV